MNKPRTAGDIKPTDIPEEMIEMLATMLNIDRAEAVDLIMFMAKEVEESSRR